MRMKDIAEKINGYLKSFESDPKLNSRSDPKRIKPYYNAGAWSSGRYIGIRYVSFQGTSYLNREQAEKYLAWLEQGGKGRHFRADV